MNDIYNKWKFFLEGIDKDKVKETALLLDNQMRFNEQDLTITAAFNRYSIPLARRVFPNLQCGAEVKFAENVSYRAILNVEFKPNTLQDLNEEARKVAQIAEKLTDAIDAFVFGIQSEANTFLIFFFGLNENKIVLFYDLE